MAMLGTLSISLLSITGAAHKRGQQDVTCVTTFAVAEGGLNEAFATYEQLGRDAFIAIQYPRDFGGIEYSVTATYGDLNGGMDDDLVRLVATCSDAGAETSLELYVREGGAAPETFPWGVFGKNKIEIKSNSYIDSYDSSAGSYSSQATNSQGSVDYANGDGSVGSNKGIVLDSNALITGDAAPGPSSSVSIQGNSHVYGSTTPLASAEALPAVVVPSVASTGSISMSSGSKTVGPGDYKYSKIEMDSNGTLTIVGPATVVVGDFYLDSNSRIFIDTSGGDVEMYVTGSFEQKSNALMRPIDKDPGGFSLSISGSSPDVKIDSNPELIGQVYAPGRDFEIKSNAQVYGSLVANRLTLDSDAGVHIDEALSSGGGGSGGGDLEVVSWRVLARANR